MTLRLMAVHAHPDDESSKGAATLAYYRARGAEVMVVSCTGGERGDILNPAVASVPLAHRDLPGLRRREMAAARQIIGAEHRWLGYRDSGMPNEDGSVPALSFASIPLETSVQPLLRLVRSFRPQVIVAYDENGGYPHPDHIRAHEVAVAAFRLAPDTDAHPELGAPWAVSKLYYDRIFSADRFRAIIGELLRERPDAPEAEEWRGMLAHFEGRSDRVTTRVPVGEYFETRDNALRAHASQVSPESSFFFWPNELQRRVWPSEDFERIVPAANDTTAETDLFDGVEDTE